MAVRFGKERDAWVVVVAMEREKADIKNFL